MNKPPNAPDPLRHNLLHELFLLESIAFNDALFMIYDLDSPDRFERCLSAQRTSTLSKVDNPFASRTPHQRGLLYRQVRRALGLGTSQPVHAGAINDTLASVFRMAMLRVITPSNSRKAYETNEILRAVNGAGKILKNFLRGDCICGCSRHQKHQNLDTFALLSDALYVYLSTETSLYWFHPEDVIEHFVLWLNEESYPCARCGQRLVNYREVSRPGRRREYCSNACRQASYRHRGRHRAALDDAFDSAPSAGTS